MNVIRNLSLRYKLIIIFVILALISVASLYVFRLFLLGQLFQAALPSLQFGEITLLNNQVQKEAVEYLSTGEEESVEQFHEGVAQLTPLISQLSLYGTEGTQEILVAGEATISSLIETGEGIIQSHGQTLGLLESLEELEDEKESALAVINREGLLDDPSLSAEVLLLNRSVVLAERLHRKILEFVLTGEDEALEDIEAARATLLATIEALQASLVEKDLAQPVTVQPALDAFIEIEGLSAQIVASHTETLELLEELEALESQAEEVRIALNGLAEENVLSLFEITNQIVWVGGAITLVFFAGIALFLARIFVRPTVHLRDAAQKLGQGDYSTRVEVTSGDELGELMANFNEMAVTLGQSVANAQRQAQAFSASSEVSRRLSTILDTSELTTAVVELLQVTFKYYHAHIYLYDEAREYLVMAGGTGEAGRAMLENKHKIESGKGLVGRTAADNKPTLVPDVTADPDWLPNPLLPGTKAEVAVPIILEDEVLGVLDIQHNVAGGLGQADVTLLTSIASQVAIGLQNARQYQQVQESEARTQAVLDAINVPLLITRVSDGSFMYFNDPALEAVGISRHNLTGRKASIFYNDESSGRQQFMAMLREKGRVDNLELTLKRVTGEPFQVVMSARVINFQGEPAVMTSFIDVTEQHKTQGALLRRAAEMETVADLGTVSATILDPDRLLKEVVNLIKARFDLYHAHIHLLNDTKDTMVLTAGAGEIGQKMVAEGRQIPLAAKGSLVATVARTRQGAIRNYDPPGEGFMPHPLLSKTSCEMAVPISVGDEVLGVLDVRSEELNYFTEADMQTYTIMASQIAVALQNARSYSKSEEAVRELQELSRRLTREGWNEFFQQQLDELVFRYDLEQVSQVLDSAEEPVADMQALLTQPLQVQGESIGELLLGSARLNAVEAAEILAAVADRLSAHLENLRLAQQTQIALNETQQRTEELAVLNEMSQSLTAQTTVDGVFQTVYDYLSRLMDTTNFYTVLYEEDSNEVVFVLTASGEELRWYTERRQAGHGITEYLIRQRQPLLMPDNVGQRLAALGVEGYGKLPESWMGVPIILGERVLGVIGLESYATPYLYSEQHLNLLTAVANQAAIAIESKRLLEGTVALAEEEQILRQITTRVSAAIDAESILRTAAEEIGRALGLEGDIVLEGVGSNGTARAVNSSKN